MRTISLIQRLRNKIKIHKNNTVVIGEDTGLSGCTIIVKGSSNRLIIGNHSRLRNMTIEIVGNNCTLEIGENCVIGHGCYLSAKEENIQLSIGDDCMFSRNVNILTSDGHPIYQKAQRINPAQNIQIGNHVWLADDVTILKGVTIGNGSIVGIHSLVTKMIPDNSIAVGIPAQIVKNNIHWEI
jgi:acetyltransferase-like isoleucine patch superfamily enzyme